MKYLTKKITFILIVFLLLPLFNPRAARAQLGIQPRELILEGTEKATVILENMKEKTNNLRAKDKIDEEIQYLKDKREQIKNIQKPEALRNQALEMQKRLKNFQLENKKRLGINIVSKMENIVTKLENLKNKLKLQNQDFEAELKQAKESLASAREAISEGKFAQSLKSIQNAQKNLKKASLMLRSSLRK